MKIVCLVTSCVVIALMALFSVDAVAGPAPKRLPMRSPTRSPTRLPMRSTTRLPMRLSPDAVKQSPMPQTPQAPQAPEYETINPANGNCENLPSEHDVLDTFNFALMEISIDRPSNNMVRIIGSVWARGTLGARVPDGMAVWSRITIPGMETVDICRATNYMTVLSNDVSRDFWFAAIGERMEIQNPTTSIIGHPLIVEVDPDNHVSERSENDNTITCTSLELPPENAPTQHEYAYRTGYAGVCYVPRRVPIGGYIPN